MARPKKEINWEHVKKRMEAGNKAKEIAHALEIDLDTFYIRFKEQFKCGFQDFSVKSNTTGDSNIAYAQYMKALSGNVQMLIWLGKVRCGQREVDLLSTTPPLQDSISKDHLIMELQNKIATLEANANQPEAR